MSIDDLQVRRIAELACLDLDEPTRRLFRRQLRTILDHVALLDELDLADVPPTSVLPMEEPRLREDSPQPTLPQPTSLRGAPKAVQGFFRLPRILPVGSEEEPRGG